MSIVDFFDSTGFWGLCKRGVVICWSRLVLNLQNENSILRNKMNENVHVKKGEYIMTDKMFENNQVAMTGEIVTGFQFSHEVLGEGFYTAEMAVNRLSNYADYIPLMVSERLVDTQQDYTGQLVRVSGQFRSYNRHEEKKNRLVLSVFVREWEFADEIGENGKNKSDLSGRLCMQRACLPENPSWKGDRGPAHSCKPFLWKIRLYPMYLLGQERQIRLRI